MNHLKNILFLLILILVLNTSCTERIDISLDESTVKLVVEGSITTERKAHKVFLSTTSGYFYNQKPESVQGAAVSISDGVNIFNLTETDPGVYQTAQFVRGNEGNTYTLNIKLNSQVGGYTEYTASSKILPVANPDSVKLLYHPEWSSSGLWEVMCYFQDPPTTDFYRFLVSKNGTLVSDTLDEWVVTDDRFFNGYYVNGATVAYLDQGTKEERLTSGDIVVVEMNNLSEEYASFIWDSQSEIRGSYPLFSGPPANVKGNISNNAIGFFSAHAVRRALVSVPASY
ncbi:MAG: DUF4249 domain-containing protein [Bacteroidales bacterium]|nr:DUF4249 domain-containing protein [Bacteroidales bacterium]